MNERQLDANKIIQALQRRIGELVSQYETELAVRDAVIESMQEGDENNADAR